MDLLWGLCGYCFSFLKISSCGGVEYNLVVPTTSYPGMYGGVAAPHNGKA
ncbi:MAG: hypothetical protein C5S47_05600 [Candidatus Methanogasteraceae archaeon]|nr:MAG: hypothetical protein C5S47_05600 [ANME-2 cluster archaeon]